MLSGPWERRLRSTVRVLALVLAALVVALAGLLVAYLTGDDLAARIPISRWAAHADDGGARAVFWLSIALVVGAAATLIAGARSTRLGLTMAGTALAALAVLAETAAFVRFTAV